MAYMDWVYDPKTNTVRVDLASSTYTLYFDPGTGQLTSKPNSVTKTVCDSEFILTKEVQFSDHMATRDEQLKKESEALFIKAKTSFKEFPFCSACNTFKSLKAGVQDKTLLYVYFTCDCEVKK